MSVYLPLEASYGYPRVHNAGTRHCAVCGRPFNVGTPHIERFGRAVYTCLHCPAVGWQTVYKVESKGDKHE